MRVPSIAGVCGAALLLSLLPGSVAGTAAPWVSPAGNGTWVLAADFHVHAAGGDLGLLPWDLRREARRAGLDVIAVTNHVGTGGGRVHAGWAEGKGWPLVLVGQEVTGADYHMTAVGIRETVDNAQVAARAIADIHAQGGIAIAAHPFRSYTGFDAEARATLDGVERAHPGMFNNDFARRDLQLFYDTVRQENPTVAAIGSSDFHVTAPIGAARTYVVAASPTAEGVLDAVRAGQTVAAAGEELFGPPHLVEQVRAYRQQHAHEVWSVTAPARLLVLVACVSLLGLVLSTGVRIPPPGPPSATGPERGGPAAEEVT